MNFCWECHAECRQSSECEKKIREEVPHRGATNGENLAEIEIPFQLVGQNPQNQRIDSQSDSRHNHESAVFCRDMFVGALERPQPVKDIIRSGRADETNRIAHIFVNLYFLLEKISDTKIYKKT